MCIIQECAINYRKLANTTSYIFHTSLKGKISVIEIDFEERDFHHAIGLQYLTDIDIPRNPKNAISWILDNSVTDVYLSQSSFYKGKINEFKTNVKKIISFYNVLCAIRNNKHSKFCNGNNSARIVRQSLEIN